MCAGYSFHLENKKEFVFVNPFNDLNDTKCRRYDAIQYLLAAALDNRSSTIVFSGDANSGKSYLAEMLVTELSMKFFGMSTALSSAMLITNAFVNVRDSFGKFSSIASTEYSVSVKDSCLSHVSIGMCMTELSPILLGNVKIFEILNFGLVQGEERAKYFLGAVSCEDATVDVRRQMRDIQLAFSVLSISASDVFRVVAACMLLQGVTLVENSPRAVATENIGEIEKAATLLGVSPIRLYLCIVKPFGTSMNKRNCAATAREELANLIKALYQRCVWSVLRRINIMLRHYCSSQAVASSSIVSDGESSTNDSGVGLPTKELNVTVIDCFGATKSSAANFSASLKNTAAEIFAEIRQDGQNSSVICSASASLGEETRVLSTRSHDHSVVSKTCGKASCSRPQTSEFAGSKGSLRKVSNTNRQLSSLFVQGKSLIKRRMGNHRELEFGETDPGAGHSNTLSCAAINLLASNECNSPFVKHLLTSDFDGARENEVSEIAVQIPYASDTARRELSNSFTDQFHAELSKMLSKARKGSVYRVHCVPSNKDQEYSHFSSANLGESLGLLSSKNRKCPEFQARPKSKPIDDSQENATPEQERCHSQPQLPFDRNYTVKDSKKYSFPQRRKVINDYNDATSGYTFRIDDVIRVSGFVSDNESFLVDVDQYRKPSIPAKYTRLSKQFHAHH
ncbi:hypothetical protein L596_003512 [Steinernema carpocapsae]|uniref:Myosin motor domain-containing protein n=1 Tax=Steinernema carpocapsae TaxID=34508 RepID=A0A4U8USY5_STECR|nr:hypothetical protein L596_003512 [Steinernema carpocapsae]